MEGGGEGVVAVGEVEGGREVLWIWGLVVKEAVGALGESCFGKFGSAIGRWTLSWSWLQVLDLPGT